jgi:hypothetical protein
VLGRASERAAPEITPHEEFLRQACITERDRRVQSARTAGDVRSFLESGRQIQRLPPGRPFKYPRHGYRSVPRDRDPDWPPKPPKISEQQRHERRIWAGIVFLCPHAHSWMHQRKGVDSDDQKLAKMLWTEYRRVDTGPIDPEIEEWAKAKGINPKKIGGYWRPLTRAEAAAELGWDRDKVDRRVARIIKELTGKTEAEILSNRYGLGPFVSRGSSFWGRSY